MVFVSKYEMYITGFLFVILLLFIAIVVLAFCCYGTYKQTKQSLIQLTKYDINCRTSIDASIPHILDLIIDDCFTDYKIMVLIPKNESYITAEREKEIRSDLIHKLTERLSPEAVEKLSIFYNIKNIDKVIADKIYITVMNYCIEHNQVLPSEKRVEV